MLQIKDNIDTDTTYSPGAGISLDGTTFSNSGVREVATGSSDGTISVNTNGTVSDIAVKGLGSAAYTASTAYSTAGHNHDGTYVPTTKAGTNAALNRLTTGWSIPTDNDYYISQHVGGGTTTTTYHRRPVSALWNYIKGKADTVYATKSHTHSYAGSSSAGGAATSANKLNTDAGSATGPVYFSDGVPVACTAYADASVLHAETADSATNEYAVQSGVSQPTDSRCKVWLITDDSGSLIGVQVNV